MHVPMSWEQNAKRTRKQLNIRQTTVSWVCSIQLLTEWCRYKIQQLCACALQTPWLSSLWQRTDPAEVKKCLNIGECKSYEHIGKTNKNVNIALMHLQQTTITKTLVSVCRRQVRRINANDDYTWKLLMEPHRRLWFLLRQLRFSSLSHAC